MIILGGDRHMVSFNDAYMFKLNKGVESLPHYEWSKEILFKEIECDENIFYQGFWASFKTATLALIEDNNVSSISFFFAMI